MNQGRRGGPQPRGRWIRAGCLGCRLVQGYTLILRGQSASSSAVGFFARPHLASGSRRRITFSLAPRGFADSRETVSTRWCIQLLDGRFRRSNSSRPCSPSTLAWPQSPKRRQWCARSLSCKPLHMLPVPGVRAHVARASRPEATSTRHVPCWRLTEY